MNTKVYINLSKLTKFEDKEVNYERYIFVTNNK